MTEKEIKNFLIEQSETIQLGFDEKGYPLIACWKIDNYHYSFYCRFCKRIHNHGLGNGHRVSHCSYWNKGYVLVLQGDLTQ